MLNRRRLIHSKLYLKDIGAKKKFKHMGVALSGIPDPGDGSYLPIPAQIQLFKENYDPTSKSKRGFQNPKLTISLEGASINMIGYVSQLSGRKGSSTSSSFSITACNGISYELTVDNEPDRIVWVTVLEFLAMFPYTSVPEVPRCNPVFRRDLCPDSYSADSVWPVYILPEEVGSRCSIIGSNILALQGRITGFRQGKIQIYNLTDSSSPVITWDHDKIRRTGKLGRLLFIEIGRRCRGGPGLVWIYIGADDKRVFEFRDVLRRFLFEDARQCPKSSSAQLPPVAASSLPTCVESPLVHSLNNAELVPPPLPPFRRTMSSPGHNSTESTNTSHPYHILEPTLS